MLWFPCSWSRNSVFALIECHFDRKVTSSLPYSFVFNLPSCAQPPAWPFVWKFMLLILFRRKTLLLATGILVAGGAATYVQSRFSGRKHDSFRHYNGLNDDEEKLEKVVSDTNNVKKNTRKKGGLKSLQVLASILLSEMGKMGTRDLLALVAIVVSLFLCTSEVEGLICFLFANFSCYNFIFH